MMNLSRLWVVATIIGIAVLAGFLLSAPRVRDGAATAVSETVAVAPAVSVNDSFRRGVHTITGSLIAPNACAPIVARASLAGDASNPSGIALDISFSEDSGICLQLPTRATFSVTVTAPARLPISASINGSPATTTVL